jgi:hypothetical protein
MHFWPGGIPPIKPPPWAIKMIPKSIQLQAFIVLALIILFHQPNQTKSMLASKMNAINQHQFTIHQTPNPILLNTNFNTENLTLSSTSYPTPHCNAIIFPPYHNTIVCTTTSTLVTHHDHPPSPRTPLSTTTIWVLNTPNLPWKQNIFSRIKHQRVLTHKNTNRPLFFSCRDTHTGIHNTNFNHITTSIAQENFDPPHKRLTARWFTTTKDPTLNTLFKTHTASHHNLFRCHTQQHHHNCIHPSNSSSTPLLPMPSNLLYCKAPQQAHKNLAVDTDITLPTPLSLTQQCTPTSTTSLLSTYFRNLHQPSPPPMHHHPLPHPPMPPP